MSSTSSLAIVPYKTPDETIWKPIAENIFGPHIANGAKQTDKTWQQTHKELEESMGKALLFAPSVARVHSDIVRTDALHYEIKKAGAKHMGDTPPDPSFHSIPKASTLFLGRVGKRNIRKEFSPISAEDLYKAKQAPWKALAEKEFGKEVAESAKKKTQTWQQTYRHLKENSAISMAQKAHVDKIKQDGMQYKTSCVAARVFGFSSNPDAHYAPTGETGKIGKHKVSVLANTSNVKAPISAKTLYESQWKAEVTKEFGELVAALAKSKNNTWQQTYQFLKEGGVHLAVQLQLDYFAAMDSSEDERFWDSREI